MQAAAVQALEAATATMAELPPEVESVAAVALVPQLQSHTPPEPG